MKKLLLAAAALSVFGLSGVSAHADTVNQYIPSQPWNHCFFFNMASNPNQWYALDHDWFVNTWPAPLGEDNFKSNIQAVTNAFYGHRTVVAYPASGGGCWWPIVSEVQVGP
jgi:hypothetical protein